MIWLLIGCMWLFIHRPYEVWPWLAEYHIERVYVIFMICVWLWIGAVAIPRQPSALGLRGLHSGSVGELDDDSLRFRGQCNCRKLFEVCRVLRRFGDFGAKRTGPPPTPYRISCINGVVDGA